ncbi:hypothetical protein EV669_101238 [Gulbenkiania mobilis]|uniref:DUF1272 domain-containing protein n=2 Tax=Gulbenkiania mobilis TaxID=397457 RepID=A0ABY2D085_GULMO|nr:hypothetical protein EV669_101238 [Gulbenkiania mobilis]
MLEMRPGCECCDTDLPAGSVDAFICSFECTFCRACAAQMQGRCPNCGGVLLQRPSRQGAALDRHPASTQRVHRPEHCAHNPAGVL